jgi:hypothetical protein
MDVRYRVELSQGEPDELASQRRQALGTQTQAGAGLAGGRRRSDDEIVTSVGVSGSTVYRTKRRFVLGNLGGGTQRRAARPGARRKLSGREEALLVATACSGPTRLGVPIGPSPGRRRIPDKAKNGTETSRSNDASRKAIGSRLSLSDTPRPPSCCRPAPIIYQKPFRLCPAGPPKRWRALARHFLILRCDATRCSLNARVRSRWLSGAR